MLSAVEQIWTCVICGGGGEPGLGLHFSTLSAACAVLAMPDMFDRRLGSQARRLCAALFARAFPRLPWQAAVAPDPSRTRATLDRLVSRKRHSDSQLLSILLGSAGLGLKAAIIHEEVPSSRALPPPPTSLPAPA